MSRIAYACLALFFGCGFPSVALDGSMEDATIDSTITDGDAMMEAGAPSDAPIEAPPVMNKGCKTVADCTESCFGKLGSCGCVAYLVDSAAPFCDTLCSTACVGKSTTCTDAGDCLLK